MTALADILAGAEPIEGGFRVTIPADWLQGRTSYGGLSAALALHAAQASDSDLPPLRSALIAFVGPLAGVVSVTARRLRRGRNAAFVDATIESDAGIGCRATFTFMAAVESRIDHDRLVPTPHAPPATDAKLFEGFPNHFTQNFQFYNLADHAGPAEWLRWARLRERAELDPEVAFIVIADALPPAALQLTGGPAPVSSLTWMINLIEPRPETRDGWWLLHTSTDRAASGYSSQRMTIWNADGRPVADAMQGVAVFA